jgi:hypothetical protein
MSDVSPWLEDVEQFHQIDVSLQTKQYLWDTREHLQRMVKTVNVAEFALNTLAVGAVQLLNLHGDIIFISKPKMTNQTGS